MDKDDEELLLNEVLPVLVPLLLPLLYTGVSYTKLFVGYCLGRSEFESLLVSWLTGDQLIVLPCLMIFPTYQP
jgi:hypothetical protein